MYDVIIVGAGPAGLTAALYLARAGKSVLILEAEACGGQIAEAPLIDNYPGIASVAGGEFVEILQSQVEALGVEIVYEIVTKITSDKNVETDKNTYQAKVVIIANGVKHRKLGLPHEDDFLGRGVSYCATCDGAFYRGKTVAVVGGANSAMAEALYLSDIAQKVYLICRDEKLSGEQQRIVQIEQKPNVDILLNTEITALLGEEKLESIQLKKINDTEEKLTLDALFVAVGRVANNQAFVDVVDLDKDGYIVSSDAVHTKTAGVYVAGDTRAKQTRQLATAVGDGANVATVALQEFLRP